MNIFEPSLEPYCDYDPMEDWVHVDELSKYDDAESLIRKIIKNLYTTGDVLQFEDDFEELANIFDVNLPNKEPIIAKKKVYDKNVHLKAIN